MQPGFTCLPGTLCNALNNILQENIALHGKLKNRGRSGEGEVGVCSSAATSPFQTMLQPFFKSLNQVSIPTPPTFCTPSISLHAQWPIPSLPFPSPPPARCHHCPHCLWLPQGWGSSWASSALLQPGCGDKAPPKRAAVAAAGRFPLHAQSPQVVSISPGVSAWRGNPPATAAAIVLGPAQPSNSLVGVAQELLWSSPIPGTAKDRSSGRWEKEGIGQGGERACCCA